MTKKFVLAALSLTAIAAPASAQRLPAAVVAIVDLQRVTAECTACKSALAALQAQEQSFQTRQQTLATPLQAEEKAIQAAIDALPAAQRANPPVALKTRVEKYQQSRAQAAQELQQLQGRLQSTEANVNLQIANKLDTIYPGVMTARGASVLVDKRTTLASSGGIDVTNDVLAQLNSQLPAVSVTPLPQQQQPTQARPQGR
jgi:Skp family chaperone for outer membrane proteins